MKIALRPAAERDIAEAMVWFDEQRSGLGDEFLSRVNSLLVRIQDRPSGFPTTHNGFKRAILGRFPYTIYFRGQGEYILVFAVYHQRRNPLLLQQRLSDLP